MIRLAFVIHFDQTWLGGLNVILNLINSILKSKFLNSKIKIVLITNSKRKIKKLRLNKEVEIIEDLKFFKRNIFIKILDKISIILIGKSIFLEKFFIKYNVNYLSHTTLVTGNKSLAKSIVWIPDFQYLYFPEFFSFRYKILKNINLKIYKKHAYKVLLSSNTARKDLKKICNISKSKILVNKFSFDVENPKNLRKFNHLRKKYSLKKNFFYMPNQYWLHKNHRVVIEALNRISKKSRENIIIYSSGSNQDYRNPQNFQNIIKLVSKYKLQKNYVYLGLIPFLDVMSLIYYSLAVINPSYFEGWSSSVEQAKAYNKKIILSQIDVHKEQNPKYAYYFRPDDSKMCSKILMKLNKNFNNKIQIFQKHNYKQKKSIDLYTKKYCKIILKHE